MRHIGVAFGLVVVWVALWGSASPANVVSGVIVAMAVLAAAPLARPARGELKAHPWPLVKFFVFFLFALTKASVVVAATIVRRRTEVTSGIVAVPLRTESDALLTLVANTISLTPGTLTIEADPSTATLYVHVLHVADLERVRSDIARLARLAVSAFGSPADVRAHLDHHVTGSTP